jgi:hypothetical protein
MRPIRLILTAGLLVLPIVVQGQPTAHYPPGIHGLNAATLPPPGVYLRDYNLFYFSDRLNDGHGNPTGPANFDAFTYANVIRPIWITKLNILGGYLGTDIVIPLVDRHLTSGAFSDSTFGLGDIFPEVTMSWHPKAFDICAGVGEWMPTGESAPRPTTKPGLDYWATMFTLGATWYMDNAKTWSLSALNRYEINTQQGFSHTTTGDAWTVEWGLAKALNKTVSIGPVGYYQAKVTDDYGDHPLPDNRVLAVGGEVMLSFRPQKFYVSVRYNYEVLAENRAQGQSVALVLTKGF